MPLARKITIAILLIDLWIGACWLLGAPARSSAPVFKPARDLFGPLPGDPARAWGLILLVVAVTAVVGLAVHREQLTRTALTMGAGFWAFWVALDAVAAGAPGGSLTAPAFAFMMVVGHVRQPLDTARLTR